MPSKSKAKGNRLERQIVQWFSDRGIPCERAWGSNGAALGEAETVDNVAHFSFGKLRIQAKSRKRIADFMTVPDGADCTILKADREDPLIVMDLTEFLRLVERLEASEATCS